MVAKNNKALGQHWLKNREILDEIAFNAGEGELCVEIGPGLGTLTSSLLKRFDRVVAVEYDSELARKLPGQFPGKNLVVINKDILDFDLGLLATRYSVAGNIPYYITSPIIEKILTAEVLPETAVLLVQKEVAERILAKKGKRSVLSLWVQNRAVPVPGPVVKAEEFTPPPKVDSQVLILEPFGQPIFPEEMFKIVKIGFKSPRKKLVNNLSTLFAEEELEEIFAKLKIDKDARPADLSLRDWYDLYRYFNGDVVE